MNPNIQSVIIATGSYIPENIVPNSHFLNHHFYEKTGVPVKRASSDIISKFKDITEIEERRYASSKHNTSDLGFFAAKDALESSDIDAETLDYIIVAHNFGDVRYGSNRADVLPTLASRVKHKLGIKNANCVAYDIPFGCPGWLQGMIQANYYIKSGDAKRVLVIGAEILSRSTDPYDRDSMIYADGAAATILEGKVGVEQGILSHKTQTHTAQEAYYLYSDRSSNSLHNAEDLFIKMDGRKIYEYALTHVPILVKETLEKARVDISQIKKVLIHQANGKMDEAILKRLFKLYDIRQIPDKIMPMTIAKLGNSSVATIPTLLDLILKNKMPEQSIHEGDSVVFASVGAGMNVNAMVYQF